MLTMDASHSAQQPTVRRAGADQHGDEMLHEWLDMLGAERGPGSIGGESSELGVSSSLDGFADAPGAGEQGGHGKTPVLGATGVQVAGLVQAGICVCRIA